MIERRVCITGIGPVTSFGTGIEPLWHAMCEGRSAVREITRFDPSGFECRAAAAIADDAYEIRRVVPRGHRKATKVMCRDTELAVVAADLAVRDAGMVSAGTDPEAVPTIDSQRFGCQIGAGLIAADVSELASALARSRDTTGGVDLEHWGDPGMQNLTPLWLLKYLPNMLACHVSIVHNCQGPSNTITCCESSSALSVGEAMRVISRNDADACLSGGAENKLNPLAYMRQELAGRLASTNGQDPSCILRPFDQDAPGTLLGEGGGLLLLESECSALERNASPLAWLAGFGSSQSRCGASGDPEPDVEPMLSAMSAALEDGHAQPGEIDAVVPLGAGIQATDMLEAEAIRMTFGDRAAGLPLVTIIPFTGNCGAGHGGIALSIASTCLVQQRLPARLNAAGAEGLQSGACESAPAALEKILVLSTGQGGQNTAILLQRTP